VTGVPPPTGVTEKEDSAHQPTEHTLVEVAGTGARSQPGQLQEVDAGFTVRFAVPLPLAFEMVTVINVVAEMVGGAV
jgi:hypothetical protein